MEFLLDQDGYHYTYTTFKKKGYDVICAKDIGYEKASDESLLHEAFKRSRIFVTRDKGFGSLVFFSQIKCAGVILLRGEPQEIEKIHTVIFNMLKEYSFAELAGYFVTIEPDKFRMRKIPNVT